MRYPIFAKQTPNITCSVPIPWNGRSFYLISFRFQKKCENGKEGANSPQCDVDGAEAEDEGGRIPLFARQPPSSPV